MAKLNRDRIIALNVEYQEITGEPAYLYTSQPGDGQTRVVFSDGTTHLGWKKGYAHMQAMLAAVKPAVS